jgi:hypothetical protein
LLRDQRQLKISALAARAEAAAAAVVNEMRGANGSPPSAASGTNHCDGGQARIAAEMAEKQDIPCSFRDVEILLPENRSMMGTLLSPNHYFSPKSSLRLIFFTFLARG